jgi:hypothetical protein
VPVVVPGAVAIVQVPVLVVVPTTVPLPGAAESEPDVRRTVGRTVRRSV